MFFKTTKLHIVVLYKTNIFLKFEFLNIFLLQKVSEWTGNWTENRARTVCTNAIQDNQGIRACQNLPEVDFGSAIEQCIADIKVAI